MANVVLEPLPPEVQAIIDLINDNISVMIVNRERLRALFDASAGVSPKALIAGNDWTILRDLYLVEMNDAIAGLQSAANQTQALT